MAPKTKQKTAAKKSSKKNKDPFGSPSKQDAFEVDFPDPGESGLRIPKNRYIGRLVALTKDTSNAGNPMWVWVFVIIEGKYAGREFKLWTTLTPASMWKVGETLLALGFEGTPGEKFAFTLEEAIGRGATLVIVDDEFEGRKTSKLQGIEPHPKGAGYKPKGGGTPIIEEDDDEDEDDDIEEDDEDLDEDEEEEEEEDDEDEEEEEEEEDEDEDEDDDLDDDDEDEDVEEDDDEDEDLDDEDEDDEEEEPPPTRRAAAKKTPAKKAAAKKSAPAKKAARRR
jgi:hypothetical protein